MTIGVIGFGFVGEALYEGFKESTHTLLVYDKYKESDDFEIVSRNSDILFLCVPTPTTGGKIDLSIVEECIEELRQYVENTDKVVVVKSTIIPGTMKRLMNQYPNIHFAHNPEFLREKTYIEDFKNADRTVVGADDEHSHMMIKELYNSTYPNTPYYKTDVTSAELVKYMANTFLAVKVIFANELYDMCEELGADYGSVAEMVRADSRIGNSHLDVTDDRGFGGMCFPKDIQALIALYKEKGIDCRMLETAWQKNCDIRQHKDWE